MTHTYPTENLRNIGIVAHVDAGKTTLTERLLYYTGKRHKFGEVHDGATVTDCSAQEREHGITINSAAVTVSWRDHQLNIIDTPGHVDFNLEVRRALRVLDGAVVVLDAVAGVEPQTEANWRLADEYQVPRLCVVNKMDRTGADYSAVLNQLEQCFNVQLAVLQWPLFESGRFVGVVDLVAGVAWRWTDEQFERQRWVFGQHPAIDQQRQKLLEQLANSDDAVLLSLLDEQVPALPVLRRALRKAVVERQLVPVCCASAYQHIGMQPLLDAVVDYLPAPTGKPLQAEQQDSGQAVQLQADADADFCALVFKTTAGRHGQLSWLRCYSGTAVTGQSVWNARTGQLQRLGKVWRLFADQREALTRIQPGDIVAVQGMKAAHSGDTLCASEQRWQLPGFEAPAPVVSMALEVQASADQPRLAAALRALCLEDSSLALSPNELGQTLLAGAGELHLQMVVERLASDFALQVKVGPPAVSYRERFAKPVQVDYLHKKQNGGQGQRARVVLGFEPQAGEAIVFCHQVVGGAVPAEYVAAVEQGIRRAARCGALAGYPCQGLQVTLLDGEAHSNDSSALAFAIAAEQAFAQAAQQAGCELLEPVMAVKLSTPLPSLGACLAELSRRRGQIVQQQQQGTQALVDAMVPLADTFGQVSRFRSLSAGRASCSMQFDHWRVAPASITAQVLEQ